MKVGRAAWAQALPLAADSFPLREGGRKKEAPMQEPPKGMLLGYTARDAVRAIYCTVTVKFIFGCTEQVILKVPASGNTTSFD